MKIVDASRFTDADDKGKALRYELTVAQRGDCIYVPGGTYAVGAEVLQMPDGVIVYSFENPVIQSANILDATKPCAFELGNAGVLYGLTLQSVCPIDQQSTVVGFGFQNKPARKGKLVNCNIIGRAWGLYDWQSVGNTIEMHGGSIMAARCCVAACGSSGSNAHFFDLYGVYSRIVPGLSTYQGKVTHPVYGGSICWAVRGGRLRAWNCRSDVQSDPKLPRAVGVTDWYDGGATQTIVELYDYHCRITGAVSAPGGVCDLDSRLGQFRYQGGSGSDPSNGKFIIGNNNPSTPPVPWGN